LSLLERTGPPGGYQLASRLSIRVEISPATPDDDRINVYDRVP
jgi:hypothetical protein